MSCQCTWLLRILKLELFFKMCLLILLHWVLVVARRIFSCGMRTLSCSSVGSSSLTRDWTWALALGTQSLSHWTTGKVPLVIFFKSRPKIEWYLLGFADLAFNWELQPQQLTSLTQDVSHHVRTRVGSTSLWTWQLLVGIHSPSSASHPAPYTESGNPLPHTSNMSPSLKYKNAHTQETGFERTNHTQKYWGTFKKYPPFLLLLHCWDFLKELSVLLQRLWSLLGVWIIVCFPCGCQLSYKVLTVSRKRHHIKEKVLGFDPWLWFRFIWFLSPPLLSSPYSQSIKI